MTHPTRLLIVSFSPIASDARVLKQVDLFRDTHQVTTVGYGPAPDGVVEHLRIPDEYPLWRWNRAALIVRQYRHAYAGNPAIATARELLRGRSFDVALANDVEAAGVALSVVDAARLHVDLHEYSPRQKEDLWQWRLFVAPFIRWQLRTFVVRAASHSTVAGRIAREYASEFGFRPSVVTNAAPYHDLSPGDVQSPIRLVHSGAALADRGIDLIVDAVLATRADVRLDLYLTPNDPGYLAQLAARAREEDRVTVHAPVPYAELHRILNRSDIGIHLLPPVNFNNANALPNKFFDYIQARLGVIVGPSPEMSWVVNERSLGLVTGEFSTRSLTAALDGLDRDTVASWKLAADRAARPLSSEVQVVGWSDAITALSRSTSR